MREKTDNLSDSLDPQDVEAVAAVEGLAGRRAALAVLVAVLDKKQALDHVLEQDSAFHALSQQDRAFCRMIVSSVLRRLGQIDDLIAKAEARPGSTPPILQHILRMGVVQIMFMAVPDHAAVDTSVKLAIDAKMERQKGFVNGVLRTITRSGPAWLSMQDEVRLNTPEWLLKLWIEDYGLGPAAEIAAANLSEAPLDLTVKDPASKSYWASQFKATELLSGTLRKPSGGRVQDMEGFADGHWWVQDASAAMPAKLFGDIAGQQIVDLCAAPGGKSIQMASMGARVVALDRSAKRLKKLEENAARLGFLDQIEAQIADAGEWVPADRAPVPYILLDAPCSATGTIRRHPDAPHLKSAQDVTRLCDVQARILDHAFEILSVGGILVYCTCSLQRAESEDQISAFLARVPTAARLPIQAEELGGYDESLTQEGDLRVLPFHQAALGGMDGFYIARITKI